MPSTGPPRPPRAQPQWPEPIGARRRPSLEALARSEGGSQEGAGPGPRGEAAHAEGGRQPTSSQALSTEHPRPKAGSKRTTCATGAGLHARGAIAQQLESSPRERQRGAMPPSCLPPPGRTPVVRKSVATLWPRT
eukprot:15466846-Alexandrium_andersonii.AAC.1